jgi:hypothetical protein
MEAQTRDLFEAADTRAKAGMTAAVEHADRVVPLWSERALAELRRSVRVREEPFTIEQVRLAIACSVESPTDERAWGAVTQMAIKRAIIVKTGEYAAAASSNGSPKPLYRKGPGA